MFGDASGTRASLIERNPQTNKLEGNRIWFWLDSEQVEVAYARITAEHDERERSGL